MIIFLFGEDSFRSRRKLDEIKAKYLEKNRDSFGMSFFDLGEKETDAEQVISSANAGGLFSEKKLMIVKNACQRKFEEKEEKVFLAFLRKERDSKDKIIVLWDEGKISKAGAAFKFLKKHAKCQEFESLKNEKLARWIESELVSVSGGKVTINPSASILLTSYVGNDLFWLSAELEKLAAFRGEGRIEKEDVKMMVRGKVTSDVFRTLDALGSGDKKNAVALLLGHLEKGDDPFYLLSMYFFQFRNLLKVKSLENRNLNQQEISRILKLHPFVVKKSLDQARRFDFGKIKGLYEKLCQVDILSKSGKSDITLALEQFIAEA